ncbi:MAG: hypothetical protein AB1515_09200, partial [Nitrospirota bacterium]
ALAAVAVGLGGVSRFIILPRLRRGPAEESRATRRLFGRVIAAEVGAAAAVLALAALLTQLPPPSAGSGEAHMGHG